MVLTFWRVKIRNIHRTLKYISYFHDVKTIHCTPTNCIDLTILFLNVIKKYSDRGNDNI